jgi:hypothetical protein
MLSQVIGHFNSKIVNSMDNEFEYLSNRARLFFQFLDDRKIDKIFPYRAESKKELESKINLGSLQKIKNFNKLLDNLIIGKQLGFETKEKIELLEFLEKNNLESKNAFIDKMRKQFDIIIHRGFIKSSLEINIAIELKNSEILGFTDENKNLLNEIIKNSMIAKI